MIDARIPTAWRGRVPPVCSHEQILWVVGWRIDDRVKVTESTRRVLWLEFERSYGHKSKDSNKLAIPWLPPSRLLTPCRWSSPPRLFLFNNYR